ncbi:DMT family transporter [Uliginosibacterium gangwonense]|uniref:DMT family transporter n=1 Tax=Uliginosibacterium gangwonense TaxID=392736 RepID=UPI000367102C|nr:DMT family transporter [Uliginosibacterium gangwonense]
MNLLWMPISSLLFASMGLCVKLSGSHFNLGQAVFARGFIPMLMIGAWILAHRFTLRTPFWRSHLYRSSAGTIGMLLYFTAISLLPLAAAVTLNNTSTLFMALFLSFRQRPPLLILFALAMGFVGVGMILQPAISAQQWLGGVLGLCSGFMSCIAQLNLRELGRAGEPEWRTVFIFSATNSVLSLPFAFLFPNQATEASVQQVLFLVCVGVLGGLGQLALSRAFGKGRVLVTAGLGYLTVVFSSLYGMFVLGDHLDAVSWLGMLVVIAACLTTIHPAAWQGAKEQD